MAISIDYGFTPNAKSKNLAIADVDPADWGTKLVSSNSSKTSFYGERAYIAAPSDRPVIVKTFSNTIKNVYESKASDGDSKINPIYWSPILEGFDNGRELRLVVKVTDSSDPDHPIYVPRWYTLKWGGGKHPALTPAEDLALIKQAIGFLFPYDSVTDSNIAGIDNQMVDTFRDETSES
jgi:hypothetical protein